MFVKSTWAEFINHIDSINRAHRENADEGDAVNCMMSDEAKKVLQKVFVLVPGT